MMGKLDEALMTEFFYLLIQMLRKHDEKAEEIGMICPQHCFCWTMKAMLSECVAKQIGKEHPEF
jgi:metal-dependent hydrolase (beta-lactamase superfamily II)